MKKKEAAFTVQFQKWLKDNWKGTALFEIKQSKGPMPFSAVLDHQIDALLAAKHSKLIYKPPDATGFYNPCDVIHIQSSPTYIVIKYPTKAEIIDIDTFILEKERSKRKSLTSARASEISVVSL